MQQQQKKLVSYLIKSQNKVEKIKTNYIYSSFFKIQFMIPMTKTLNISMHDESQCQ